MNNEKFVLNGVQVGNLSDFLEEINKHEVLEGYNKFGYWKDFEKNEVNKGVSFNFSKDDESFDLILDYLDKHYNYSFNDTDELVIVLDICSCDENVGHIRFDNALYLVEPIYHHSVCPICENKLISVSTSKHGVPYRTIYDKEDELIIDSPLVWIKEKKENFHYDLNLLDTHFLKVNKDGYNFIEDDIHFVTKGYYKSILGKRILNLNIFKENSLFTNIVKQRGSENLAKLIFWHLHYKTNFSDWEGYPNLFRLFLIFGENYISFVDFIDSVVLPEYMNDCLKATNKSKIDFIDEIYKSEKAAYHHIEDIYALVDTLADVPDELTDFVYKMFYENNVVGANEIYSIKRIYQKINNYISIEDFNEIINDFYDDSVNGKFVSKGSNFAYFAYFDVLESMVKHILVTKGPIGIRKENLNVRSYQLMIMPDLLLKDGYIEDETMGEVFSALLLDNPLLALEVLAKGKVEEKDIDNIYGSIVPKEK